MTLRIHWRLPQGGDQAGGLNDSSMPELDVQIPFCREAESYGVDSLLVDFGINKADSIVLATALGLATSRIRLLIAYRSGLICPTSFVQQLNTLSVMIDGRFSLNIVAGSTPEEQRRYGDFAEHDERWARTDEFLSIARALWRGGEHDYDGHWYRVRRAWVRTPFVASDGRTAPEIYVGGSSPGALAVATKHANCALMPADVPSRIAKQIAPILSAGREAGVRTMLFARRTRSEAVAAAEHFRDSLPVDNLRRQSHLVESSDSQMLRQSYARTSDEWPTPWLWTGAVRRHGAMAIAIVGTYDDVADALLAYYAAGVTQFILSGSSKTEELRIFGREVIGRVREREAAAIGARCSA